MHVDRSTVDPRPQDSKLTLQRLPITAEVSNVKQSPTAGEEGAH